MNSVQKPLIKQGWLRALIYTIVVFALIITLSLFAGGIIALSGAKSGEENIIQFGFIYTIMGVGVLISTWLCRKFIDKQSIESLGFTWKGYSNEAFLGFFAAPAILGIGSLALVGLGYLSFISASIDPEAFALEVVIMLIVAFVEELLFRGYILNNLLQSMNKWVALIVSAALFAAFHGSNPGISLFAIANIFVAGIILGINYIFTKNLWFSIFFHFAWNFFQGPVLGYEVSGLKLSTVITQSLSGPDLLTGGVFGFEASLLCLVLLVLSIAVFNIAFNRRYQRAE